MLGILGFAFLKKVSERAWIRGSRKLDAKMPGNRLNAIPPLRSPDYSADGEGTLFLEVLRHGHVCGHHETFYDVLCGIMPADDEIFDFAVFHDGRSLDRTKSQCSALCAQAAQLLRDLFLESDLGLETGCSSDCLRHRP